MLQQRTALTPYDQDCLVLYGATAYLHAGADPDYHWMGRSDFYKRGRELQDFIYGPIKPVHLDPEYWNSTFASKFFNLIHGKLPKPGDMLRYDDLAWLLGPEATRHEFEKLTAVWARRLPDYPCPFRYGNDHILVRQKDGSWEADQGDLRAVWAIVEDQALGITRPLYPLEPIPDVRMSAVVFIPSKDGKRPIKPLEATNETAAVSELAHPATGDLDPAATAGVTASGIPNEARERTDR
jgi:hypothetical protein